MIPFYTIYTRLNHDELSGYLSPCLNNIICTTEMNSVPSEIAVLGPRLLSTAMGGCGAVLLVVVCLIGLSVPVRCRLWLAVGVLTGVLGV